MAKISKIIQKSKAFRKGFRDGMSAPAHLFTTSDYHKALAVNTSIHEAWKITFDLINDATDKISRDVNAASYKGKLIGKGTRKERDRESNIAA